MDLTMVVLRLLHIVLGAFWVGVMIFNAFFLGPAVSDAGPDGAKVMKGLMARNFMTIVPVVAVINLLTGIWMYWRVSGGFQPAYVHSATGGTFAAGGLLAITAFVFGMSVARPNMLKAMALGQAAAQAGADRDALLAQAQRHRMKSASASRIVAWLLGTAAAAMAVARYV